MNLLHNSTPQVLEQWILDQGEPRFRFQQLMDWIWKRGETEPVKMTNLSQALRKNLESSFILEPMVCVQQHQSSDGETEKFLWKLIDDCYVESVLIRAPRRNTICVSTQVGCPCCCRFCASGRNGLIRNLEIAEILFQVIFIRKYLEQKGEKLTNIVYMGMGEPLENYHAVTQSVTTLVDSACMGISPRRITLSTVGIVDKIYALAATELSINLALSLHAPTQEIRQAILPYAFRYQLEEVLSAVDYFREHTGRDVTYEYVLLKGVNDQEEHAILLAQLLKGKSGSVNLIPYNPVEGSEFQEPSKNSIRRFMSILEREHIAYTCRYRKGADIAAACGQLAMRNHDL